LWNPTIHPVIEFARIPVTTDYTVRDPTGQTIFTEVINSNYIDKSFFFKFPK